MHTSTWAEYADAVTLVARGLLQLGVQQGGTVALLVGNTPEHVIADLGAVSCAAATVSLYPTIADEQLEQILVDARPTVVVVPDRVQAERVRNLGRGLDLKTIVLSGVDGPEMTWGALLDLGRCAPPESAQTLRIRRKAIAGDDVVTCIYTSGTTGAPKGVLLTHANVLWQLGAWDAMGIFRSAYRAVCYLPLAHIAERLWSLYFPLAAGGHVYFCANASDLMDSLVRHRPSYFMGVPRIWEKLADAWRQTVEGPEFDSRSDEIERDRASLLAYWEAVRRDEITSPRLRADAIRAREGVLREVLAVLGLDKVTTATCGAAPLSDEVKRFFASVGISLAEAYGLTETTGIATWERHDGTVPGSAGFPLPGCEIAITDEDEILVRSPGITPGYRNVDRAKDASFRGDWLVTGDIGRIGDDGRLYVVDRKKEIIVTGSGKNIAPTAIEPRIALRGLVDQVMVVGDGRPYLVAIMTPNTRALAAFAAQREISGDIHELVQHPEVLAEVERQVDEANLALSRPEQIKRFTLLGHTWSVQSGELTPTLKLRRKVVEAAYAPLLDSLYGS